MRTRHGFIRRIVHEHFWRLAVAFWITVALWHETREADRYQRELDALERS